MDAPSAPQPADETGRLAAVRRYDVLDTPPDGAFDRITALAARLCRVPISTITIIDEDRIWFKSAHGVDVDEVGRDPGLCASAIISSDAHVVVDAASDPRTLNNPLVRGELGLRFYVGIPLVTADGHGLGTLNVIDVEPRTISEEELATLRDLAALVMDELELRLAARRAVDLEAAQEAAVFREALMEGISHEMRTPIAVLQGILGIDPEDGDLAVADLQRMMARHVSHLELLVNQYLDFTHLEAGSSPRSHAEPLDLGELAHEAATVGPARRRVDVESEPDVPLAMATRGPTLQILRELLNNADRFSPSDTAVRLAVHRDGVDEVAVTVTDEGPGITPEEAVRAFERFYQGRVSGGSGIGLYVSRALAEAQGGRLEADPDAAHGARVTLWLPIAGGQTGPESETDAR